MGIENGSYFIYYLTYGSLIRSHDILFASKCAIFAATCAVDL